MTVTLFIPVKNEVAGLRVILPQIKKEWVDKIFILDASSNDGSREYLQENNWNFQTQKSRGIKAAFWEAFEQITSDVIIPFSPDGNSMPQDIPRLIEGIHQGYDIVVASRYLGGNKSQDDDIASALANRYFPMLVNGLFRTKYTDVLGMYKAFKRRCLYDLELDKLKNEHSEIMLLTRGARYGLRISEIHSPEPKRIGPQGSRAHPGPFGKYKSGLLILKTILRDALFYWPQKK